MIRVIYGPRTVVICRHGRSPPCVIDFATIAHNSLASETEDTHAHEATCLTRERTLEKEWLTELPKKVPQKSKSIQMRPKSQKKD